MVWAVMWRVSDRVERVSIRVEVRAVRSWREESEVGDGRGMSDGRRERSGRRESIIEGSSVVDVERGERRGRVSRWRSRVWWWMWEDRDVLDVESLMVVAMKDLLVEPVAAGEGWVGRRRTGRCRSQRGIVVLDLGVREDHCSRCLLSEEAVVGRPCVRL